MEVTEPRPDDAVVHVQLIQLYKVSRQIQKLFKRNDHTMRLVVAPWLRPWATDCELICILSQLEMALDKTIRFLFLLFKNSGLGLELKSSVKIFLHGRGWRSCS